MDNPPTIIRNFLILHLIKYLARHPLSVEDDDDCEGTDGDIIFSSSVADGSFDDDGLDDGDIAEDGDASFDDDNGFVLCAINKPNTTPAINEDTDIANEP